MGLRKIALPTLHKKGDQIIPAFRDLHPFDIIEVAIDTDSFGTFSGEVERQLTPRDAAIAKARLAIEETGWSGAIASEGSIGADPYLPLLITDREVMVFIDVEEGVIIEENYRSFDIIAAKMEYRPGDDLSKFLREADFPNHHLIVRGVRDGKVVAIKGIDDEEKLNIALHEISILNEEDKLIIESDLRAHASPSRQRNIATLALILAKRVANRCPDCECAGWGRVDHEFGVECIECSHKDMRIARRVMDGCSRCGLRKPGQILRESIEPGECELCNP